MGTPGPPTSGSSRQWAGQQPRTPPSYPPAGYGGYGHMSQMSPMGYQVPYGYPQTNGRERDYGRERRDDYSRSDQRDDYHRRGSGGGPSPRYHAKNCNIASQIDHFSEESSTIFGSKLKDQVEDCLKSYETVMPREKVEVIAEAVEEAAEDAKKKKKKKKKRITDDAKESAEGEKKKNKKKKNKEIVAKAAEAMANTTAYRR